MFKKWRVSCYCVTSAQRKNEDSTLKEDDIEISNHQTMMTETAALRLFRALSRLKRNLDLNKKNCQ